MKTLYQVGLLGKVGAARAAALAAEFERVLAPLRLSRSLKVSAGADFDPRPDQASAAIYFGGRGFDASDEPRLAALMRSGTPVLPVVDDTAGYSALVPASLRSINGLQCRPRKDGMDRVASATLGLLGLLPRQRRVFLSYRQKESRDAALQLYEFLSQRQHDVFLDTHGVPPAEDFQEVLWHRLSDADVLLMLDTQGYFDSRWTREEFGRALAQSLVPVRLGWPGVKPSDRSLAGESIQFRTGDFDPSMNRFTPRALEKVAQAVERARSRGIAVRTAEMQGAVVAAVRRLGGRFVALGPRRAIVIELPGGHRITACPCLGVPTAEHLHEASRLPGASDSRAVVFDDLGLARRWQDHLSWLGAEIKSAKLLKKARAARDLAVWGEGE